MLICCYEHNNVGEAGSLSCLVKRDFFLFTCKTLYLGKIRACVYLVS